jgi:hypothetical protein
MAALLRLAAMLVSHVVASTRMLLTRLPRECHTDVERDRLPAMELGNRKKEEPAAASSQLKDALVKGGDDSSPRAPAMTWARLSASTEHPANEQQPIEKLRFRPALLHDFRLPSGILSGPRSPIA